MSPLIISAILPAAVDLIKNGVGALTTRFIGLSVDDQLKMQDADIRKLEAIAKLDEVVGTPSQWVVDLRSSFRYVAAGVLILVGSVVSIYALTSVQDAAASSAIVAFGLELAGAPFGFIFGERMWQNFKGVKK